MIGSGLKKLANENGMKVAHGVAYGSLRGYAATLSEGSGYKQIVLTTKFPDPMKLQGLQAQVNARNIQREFRVSNMSFAPDGIMIVFSDTIGTMKKIQAFIDWFWPLLEEAGAGKWDICTECGGQITSGCWKLIDGVAFYLHESCAERVRRSTNEEDTARKENDTGSYARGLLGALVGASLGAVLWAVVLSFGYVASIVGFVIGWLAEKGYTLLRGKQGKAKVAILILAVIFGVLLGNFAADAFSLMTMINAGELPGFAVGDIPGMILYLLAADSDYLAATIGNILMGLLFAALGVFALLRKTGKEVADTKILDLQ